MSSFQAKFSVWGRPSTPEQSWIRTNNTKSNMKITDNIHHWKIYLVFSGSHSDFNHALYGWFKQRWSLRTLLLLRGLLELGLRSPWLCPSRSWCLVLLRCQGTLNIAQLNIEHKQMLIWHKNQDYQKFLTDDYVNISITLMLIDSMLLVVTSSGCYGVWKRNKRMIRYYATALAAIILVQVHWDLDHQVRMVSFYYLDCCWSSCLLSERGSPFWGEVLWKC